MALLKGSVCYFKDLPARYLMELALSLIPRHYLKHEIIAKENIPTEGIYFVYQGKVDLLLTTVNVKTF
jgi:signal-transduction protein with cAMP-binding, CBS, and nucleotidyltransferase domain